MAPPGKLAIDGFVYSSFEAYPGDSSWEAHTRMRWLAPRPPGFHPQPYRQLARVLRENGDEPGATQVLIAEEDARYRQFRLLGRFSQGDDWIRLLGLCAQSDGRCWSFCSAGR